MSSAPDAPPVPARPFFALLSDVLFAPSQAFEALAAHPAFAPPLLGFVGVQATFLGVWMSRLDLAEFLRVQALDAGRPAPPVGAMSASALTGFKWMIATSGIAGGLLFTLALAGILLFIFSFVLGASTTFRHCLAVVAWTAFATALVTTPLLVATMALRGEWNLPPDRLLQTSVAAFLDRGSTGKFVYSLAQSLDVFSVWMLALGSIGMARVSRSSTASAATAVVSLWGVFVLGKALLAAAF